MQKPQSYLQSRKAVYFADKPLALTFATNTTITTITAGTSATAIAVLATARNSGIDVTITGPSSTCTSTATIFSIAVTKGNNRRRARGIENIHTSPV
jgi:streptolysin S family bacteriocin protoxin